MRKYEMEIEKRLKELGYDAKAEGIEKTNGIVKNSVIVRMPEERIGVTIYTDEMFEHGLDVDESVEKIVDLYNEHKNPPIPDTSFILSYETVKDKLTLRLYNKLTSAVVKRSAASYGFDDLILVPYIDLDMGAVKVKPEFLKIWKVSEDTVFEDAMNNLKSNVREQSMLDFLGYPKELFDPFAVRMMEFQKIVSNKTNMFGASSILVLLDSFKAKYKDGFFVIPSSVHEVLVFPNDSMDASEIDSMVEQVNRQCVSPEEVLGRKAYFFGCDH